MRFKVRIEGTRPVIHHSGQGLDPELPANVEKQKITKKRAGTRTDDDNQRLRELECESSMWLDATGQPTIPTAALRTALETAAKRLRQGQMVREGIIVEKTHFEYDKAHHGDTMEELVKTTVFTVPVVVQQSRILRTRARFELPWAVDFEVEADPDLVDQDALETWLDIAGRRLGLGDWRPEKSGDHGRFQVVNVERVQEEKVA